MTDIASLAESLRSIEADLDAGRYRPGPWAKLVRQVKVMPAAARAALAGDISRVSDKLHRRRLPRTTTLARGLTLEAVFTLAGVALLSTGLRAQSDLAVVISALVLTTTLQPPVKIAAGMLLGIGYSYAYLYGIEPRFKMRFGTYLAASPWKRILLHLAGTAGSPLAMLLVAMLADGRLPLSRSICLVLFWAFLIPAQVGPFLAGIAGLRRLGPIPVSATSGGGAAVEIREAFAARAAGAASIR